MGRNQNAAPDWFGLGRTITQESWDGFVAAHNAYYAERDIRTQHELKAGLAGWVEDFKTCRHHGNVQLAKRLYANIESRIDLLKLDRAQVYGPDPDAPTTKRFAMEELS